MQDGGHSVNIETRCKKREIQESENNKRTARKVCVFEEQRRENL